MKRRALLQGGLASLAGLLVARTVGAQVEPQHALHLPPLEDRPVQYYVAVARTCHRRFDAIYAMSDVTSHALDLCSAATASVERAMEHCRTGQCKTDGLGWSKENCDWGEFSRTNHYFHAQDEQQGLEYRGRRDIFVYSLTQEKYEALDSYLQGLYDPTCDQTSPWFFEASHGIQVTRDINLFRREDSEMLRVFLRPGDCDPEKLCPGETDFSCSKHRDVTSYNDHGLCRVDAPRRELSKPLTDLGIYDTFGTLTFSMPRTLGDKWSSVALLHATFVSRDGYCWKCVGVTPTATCHDFTCRRLQPWEPGYDLNFR